VEIAKGAQPKLQHANNDPEVRHAPAPCTHDLKGAATWATFRHMDRQGLRKLESLPNMIHFAPLPTGTWKAESWNWSDEKRRTRRYESGGGIVVEP